MCISLDGSSSNHGRNLSYMVCWYTSNSFNLCVIWKPEINVEPFLMQELRIYKFELNHNTRKMTKNVFPLNGEGTIDHRTIRWFQRFRLASKNPNGQENSGRPKSVHSDAVPKVVEVNSECSTSRVSGVSSKSSEVCHLIDPHKSIRSKWIAFHATKILPNFWLNRVKK